MEVERGVQQRMKNTFSAMVRSIFTTPSRYAYNRRLPRMISPLLPKTGGTVLDLGCGDGRYARYFDGYNYIGIDIGDYDFSAVSAPNRSFFRASADNPPFTGGSFDLVFSSFMIEHVRDIGESLEKIRSLIKSGGYIFVSTGTRCAALTGEMHRIFWPEEAESVGQAHHYFSSGKLVDMFNDAGFSEIRVRLVGGPLALMIEIVNTFFKFLVMRLRGRKYGHSRESDEAANDRTRPRKRSSLLWKFLVPPLFLFKLFFHEISYWFDLLLAHLGCAKFVVVTARVSKMPGTGSEVD